MCVLAVFLFLFLSPSFSDFHASFVRVFFRVIIGRQKPRRDETEGIEWRVWGVAKPLREHFVGFGGIEPAPE